MTTFFSRIKTGLLVSALSVFVFMPAVSQGADRPLVIQTTGNASNAQNGDSGAVISSSAILSVQVSDSLNGVGISSLGNSVGDGTSVVTLPAGWVLRDGFNLRPGGCGVDVTQFSNSPISPGTYTLRIVPSTTATCTWLSGEYHYAVQITTTIGSDTLTGTGLGVLIIP